MKDIVGMEKRKGRSMERCRGHKSSELCEEEDGDLVREGLFLGMKGEM